MPKLTLCGTGGPSLKQEGLPGPLSTEAGCPRGSLHTPCPSCLTLKADRRLLSGRPLAGKSLWAGSQAPGLGIPASCLSRAACWTEGGFHRGQANGPFLLPRPIPAEFPAISGSAVCPMMLPSRGAGENHVLSFSKKNPEMLGAKAVVATSAWPDLDPRQKSLSPSQLTSWPLE